MKQLDAREIQQILFKHESYLRIQSPREDYGGSKAILVAYIDKLKISLQTLDGAELTTLKILLGNVYKAAIQYRIDSGEAQNNLLSTAFAYRFYEQDLLQIREIRVQLAGAIDAILTALNYKDLPRIFTYLGGMMGAVMSKEEFLSNQ